jgi:myosin-crossreactive antigen
MVTYEAYTFMFDLLSFIPPLTYPTCSVKDEIEDFNVCFTSDSHARLVAHGRKLDAPDLGLINAERLDRCDPFSDHAKSIDRRANLSVLVDRFVRSGFVVDNVVAR